MRARAGAVVLVLLVAAGAAEGQQWRPAPQPGSSPWGAGDERGAANRLTPEKVLEAVRLIRSGQVFQLGRWYEEGMPLFTGRQFNVHMKLMGRGGGRNDVTWMEELLVAEIGQVGTQLDGLGHVGIGDVYYNGFDRREIQTPRGLAKLGIEKVGVFLTRGVLIDVAALKGVARLERGYEITPADLEAALARQGVRLRPGDVVLIHTGWGSLWGTDNTAYGSGAPGIGLAAADWLATQQIVLVGSDTGGTEVAPGPDPTLVFPVHQVLLTLNGIYNLENLDTAALARDHVWEFAFFFAPLRLKGFTGSPGNPVAIR